MRYILEVPKDEMALVADMLRYDDCFEVEETNEGFRVHTVQLTRDRWLSFGHLPKVLASWKTTAREDKENMLKAIGFTEGVRFTQKVLGGYLIQPK
jgi:hypothetical protein